MNKIPVGATLAQAFRFVGRNFLNLLGIMAIPMALMWAPSFLMRGQITAVQARLAAHDYAAMAQLWQFLLPLYIVCFILIAMQCIGIAELALGTKKPPRWFFLSLGRPVWRLAGSFLFLILLMVMGWLAALLLNLALTALLKAMLSAGGGWKIALGAAIILVGSVVIWCAYIYAIIRLGFLMIPVIAAREPGFGIARGWALGRGNFWRMFILLLVNWLPMIVLELALVLGVMFRGMPTLPPHPTPAQQAAFHAAMQAHTTQLVGSFYGYWYVSFPLMTLVMVLFYGFGIAAQVFAYRSLVSDEVTGY